MVTKYETNMCVIRRSRTWPQPGDYFAIEIPEGSYLFGRVLRMGEEDGPPVPMLGAYLIAVYDYRSMVKELPTEDLDLGRLLIAPFFINRMPWTRGYFENLGYAPLTLEEQEAEMSFWRVSKGVYLDQYGKELLGPVEPTGVWGLGSYRMLDDLLSDALRIPRVSVLGDG